MDVLLTFREKHRRIYLNQLDKGATSMRVSLREARRLSDRLSGVIGRGYNIQHTISVFDDIPVDDWIQDKAHETYTSVNNHLELISTRVAIRMLIGEANAEAGVNAVIAERLEAIELLSVWKNIIRASEQEPVAVDGNPAVLKKMMEARRDGKADGPSYGYGSRENVTITTIAEGLTVQAKTEARSLQKEIDQLEDQLAALNAGTKIDLSEQIVIILENVDLL